MKRETKEIFNKARRWRMGEPRSNIYISFLPRYPEASMIPVMCRYLLAHNISWRRFVVDSVLSKSKRTGCRLVHFYYPCNPCPFVIGHGRYLSYLELGAPQPHPFLSISKEFISRVLQRVIKKRKRKMQQRFDKLLSRLLSPHL